MIYEKLQKICLTKNIGYIILYDHNVSCISVALFYLALIFASLEYDDLKKLDLTLISNLT